VSQRQLSDLNISQANKILCRKHLNSSIYILNYINKIRRYLKTYIYGQYTPNPSLSIVAHIPNSTGYSSARLPVEANLHYLEKGIPARYAYAHPRSWIFEMMSCIARSKMIYHFGMSFVLKFGASMLKFATDRRSWLVKNINTEDLSAVAVSDKIPSKVQVSARVSMTLTL
jgi:hypothetical protein